MRIEDVEYEILLGLTPGERPADVLYMCHAVAASQLAHGGDFRPDANSPFVERLGEVAGRRVRLLFGAGMILCPIFEFAKHQDFQDYTEKMVAARLHYVGIATNPRLKLELGKKIEVAVMLGYFESLETADVNNLWALLAPSEAATVEAATSDVAAAVVDREDFA